MRSGRRWPRGVARIAREIRRGHSPEYASRKHGWPIGLTLKVARGVARRVWQDRSAIALPEWALIAALVAIVAATAIPGIGAAYGNAMAWAVGTLSPHTCVVPPDDGHANHTRLVC